MWSERRGFRFEAPQQQQQKPSAGATATTLPFSGVLNDEANGNDGDLALSSSSCFVTCMDYVAVPFDSEAEWAASASWYSHDMDIQDDAGGGLDWRLVTPQSVEYFLLGWSHGVVERRMVVPTGMQWVPPPPTPLPPASSSSSSSSSSAAPCREVEVLYQQRGQVMALSTLGTLVATVSCGVHEAATADGCGGVATTAVATVASSHPTRHYPAAPIHLPHLHNNKSPSSSSSSGSLMVCNPRSVLLWEGKASWGSSSARRRDHSTSSSGSDNASEHGEGSDGDAAEASMVYVFTGDEQGRVRLWRVDIAFATSSSPSSSSPSSFELLAVFACVLHGNMGDAPLRGGSSSGGQLDATAALQSRVKLLCLALDGDDAFEENSDEVGDTTTGHRRLRLLAGSDDKKLFVWDLTKLSNRRPRTREWRAVRHPPVRQQSAAAGSTTITSTTITKTFADSKLFQRFVWVPPQQAPQRHHDVAAAAASVIDGAEVRRRKRVTALGSSYGGYIGQVVNIQHQQEGLLHYAVSFDGPLSKPLECRLEEVQVVHVSSLAFLADDRGAVFSVAMLHDGLVVSGGADGGVKLWCWNAEASRYLPLPTLATSSLHRRRAHRDLITRVGVLCPPSTFFSASLDGFVRTWRLKAPDNNTAAAKSSMPNSAVTPLLEVVEESALLVRPAHGWSVGPASTSSLSSSPPKVPRGERAPIAAACVHREFGALFVAHHMSCVLRSYTFLDVDGCALPPGGSLAYDGTRTVVLSESSSSRDGNDDDGDDAPPNNAPDDLAAVFAALEDKSDTTSSSDDNDDGDKQ